MNWVLRTTNLFLTRQRMTHSASWMERSASSITSLLEPRTTMLTVFPGLVQPVIWTKKKITTDISEIGKTEGRKEERTGVVAV